MRTSLRLSGLGGNSTPTRTGDCRGPRRDGTEDQVAGETTTLVRQSPSHGRRVGPGPLQRSPVGDPSPVSTQDGPDPNEPKERRGVPSSETPTTQKGLETERFS